jgi:hypothetical protein
MKMERVKNISGKVKDKKQVLIYQKLNFTYKLTKTAKSYVVTSLNIKIKKRELPRPTGALPRP